MKSLTEKQKATIERNLKAFTYNFGNVRIERANYGPGLYVYFPADSDKFIQFCENADYLNGWLYGAVQGFMCGEFKQNYKG